MIAILQYYISGEVMEIEKLSICMQEVLSDLGAKNIQIYNTENRCNYAKRIILATAQDNISARKITLNFKDKFKTENQCFHTDGLIKGEWVILDFHDVIVHIFTNEARQKYNIDKMWNKTQI